ncbi:MULTISPECIES: hypothetical protein [unclassified Kitasatospora]|uniref:hypothetical protein n=1 Tax=unclassified Kitasatospora TaxID=2633591 RepID=UPI002475B17C|nr:hypothetical protein [Kitasatospora sp. MAP12-44]
MCDIDNVLYGALALDVTGEADSIGEAYRAKTLTFEADVPEVGQADVPSADEAEIAATVQVMGGADWELWVRALEARGLLADGFQTVALSYLGSELTAPIYRAGTIGAAKRHLEDTARRLDSARTVVAGAAVTQASTAIPSVALYTSILRAVLGPAFQSTVAQATALWSQLTGAVPLALDGEQRIRLDGWELDPDVQSAVRERWAGITTASLADGADTRWLHEQVGQLYGWSVPGTDYGRATETSVPWPV